MKTQIFVSLLKADKGKTLALICWLVRCVMTSPEKLQDKFYSISIKVQYFKEVNFAQLIEKKLKAFMPLVAK